MRTHNLLTVCSRAEQWNQFLWSSGVTAGELVSVNTEPAWAARQNISLQNESAFLRWSDWQHVINTSSTAGKLWLSVHSELRHVCLTMIQVFFTHLVDGNSSVSLHFTLIMKITEERRRVLASFWWKWCYSSSLTCGGAAWSSHLNWIKDTDQCVWLLECWFRFCLSEAEDILALCEHAVPPRDASLPPHCSRTRRTPGSRFDSDLDSLFLGAGQKVWREMCDFCFVCAASGSLLTRWSCCWTMIITHSNALRLLRAPAKKLSSDVSTGRSSGSSVKPVWTYEAVSWRVQSVNVWFLFVSKRADLNSEEKCEYA